jgi:hypothetical protein
MDIQSAAITGIAVAGTDYALMMVSPTMYSTYSRPVQLVISGAVASVAYGFLMGGPIPG